MTNAQMAHKMGLDKFTGYVEDCDSLAKILKTMGFKVEEDDRRTFEATIMDEYDNALVIRFGNDVDNLITARVDKINGTHKWYYGKTVRQLLAVVRQCMEGHTFPEPEAEEPEMKEEENTMTYTAEEIAHMTEETDRISEQEEQEIADQIEAEEEAKEIMKEEEAMKTTLNLTEGIAKFTTLDGTTYTYHIETRRYSKTVDGKTTRIGKAEYESAKHEYEAEQYIANLELHPIDEQAELDKEPCRVEVNSDLYKPAVFRKDCPGCVDCSECNVIGCVHRDCMRRNPKSEGGLGECPRLDVKPQQEEPDEVQDPELEQIMKETGLEASDAELERNIRHEHKKPRRSKDIAYEGNGVTLTAKQVDFLRELRKTEAYKEGRDGMVIEDVTITIGGQFEDKPMTVGAMISTLCEKHLGTRTKAKVEKRTVTVFRLTPSGKDIMNAIK